MRTHTANTPERCILLLLLLLLLLLHQSNQHSWPESWPRQDRYV
jgi:hypothetical protein